MPLTDKERLAAIKRRLHKATEPKLTHAHFGPHLNVACHGCELLEQADAILERDRKEWRKHVLGDLNWLIAIAEKVVNGAPN